MSDGKPQDDAPTEIGSLRVFPTVRKDDPEDVSWALSTAEAMWNRGDATEAIKWIRRAAEAASECDRDMRALELAKAAAELASLPQTEQQAVVVARPMGAPAAPPVTMPKLAPHAPAPHAAPTPYAPHVAAKAPSAPPPPMAAKPPSVPPAGPHTTPLNAPKRPNPGLTPPMPMARPGAPATTTPTNARAMPPVAPAAPTTTPLNARPPMAPSPGSAARPAMPAVTAGAGASPAAPPMAPKPASGPGGPTSPRMSPMGVARPVIPARPMLELVPASRASLDPHAPRADAGDGDRPTFVSGNPMEGAVISDRMRNDPETTSQVNVPVMPKTRDRSPAPATVTRRDAPIPAIDPDAWPTSTGDEIDDDRERTRLAVPAVVLATTTAGSVAAAVPRAKMPAPCQAVKVILYRAPDGSLRIAPHGAAVSAVKVDAMLVALEPGADLLTWLSSD